MDKNTVIGLVLIAIILVVYSMYNVKQMKEKQAQKKEVQSDSIDINNYNPPQTFLDTASQKEEPATSPVLNPDSVNQKKQETEFGPFYQAGTGTEQEYTLENDKIRLTFSNKGGRIKKVQLKNYKTAYGDPLILFDEEDYATNYQFFIQNNRVINTQDLYFQREESNDPNTISFVLRAGEDQYLEQSYTLKDSKKFLVDYDLRLVGMNQIIPRNANYLNLYLKENLRLIEKSKKSEDRYTSLFYKYSNDDLSSLSQSGTSDKSLSTPVEWISFKQQFFNSTIINKEGFNSGTVKSKDLTESEDYLKTMEASLILPYDHRQERTYSFQYYFGPNHYQTLKSMKIDLEDIVMVTGFMSWVSVVDKWVIIPIFNFLNRFITNYGIIILILTLLIKLVLFPLTYRSYKSMAMMKALKPELDELKEKYKDDQQRFGTEQWKLYQRAGVSPLGGCLPMFLQMPILIAMYYFFPTSIELRQQPFLWASDLSNYDSILNLPFTIPFYGDHVSLFTLLMTASSILYAATQTQMNTGPASMKFMPYVFPIMLLGLFNNFPAALTYYYFLANIISYSQQFIIKRFFIDEEALHRTIQENKKKPIKKSGFQKRLEDMAKQQRAMQQQRGKKK